MSAREVEKWGFLKTDLFDCKRNSNESGIADYITSGLLVGEKK